MESSQELARQELLAEKTALTAIQDSLSEKDKRDIIAKAAELVAFQQRQEDADFDILPTVTLDDVNPDVRLYPIKKEKIGHIDVYHHDAFTNEIAYADITYRLPPIVEQEMPYVRLMTSLMSQMGSGGRSYEKTLEYIQANTGGIGASLSLNLQASNRSHFYPSLSIRGKALHRKVPNLFALMQEISFDSEFK